MASKDVERVYTQEELIKKTARLKALVAKTLSGRRLSEGTNGKEMFLETSSGTNSLYFPFVMKRVKCFFAMWDFAFCIENKQWIMVL